MVVRELRHLSRRASSLVRPVEGQGLAQGAVFEGCRIKAVWLGQAVALGGFPVRLELEVDGV